jgi:Protein of unknown function (DUF1566)
MVKGTAETGTESITITKGETAPVTILAKAKQPPPVENKPLVSTSALRYPLRATKRDNLSEADVKNMLREKNFYSSDVYSWSNDWSNPKGTGLANEFELQQDGKVIYDRATGLMWQQSGSPESMTYEQAQAYVAQLNKDRFAGFDDWRLPTLEEAMSLMEPKTLNGDLHIDSKFDAKQRWIWTADMYSAGRAWCVAFGGGYCYRHDVGEDLSGVRAVRS